MAKMLLCTNYSPRALQAMPFPALAQVKADGVRCMIHVAADGVTLWSRGEGGHTYRGLDALCAVLSTLAPGWYDGELLFGPARRQGSNGLAQQALRGTLTPEAAATARVVLWDYLDAEAYDAGESPLVYTERLELLEELVAIVDDPRVQVVAGTVAPTRARALSYYRAQRRRGEEGIVVKDPNGLWRVPNGVSYRSPQQVKEVG